MNTLKLHLDILDKPRTTLLKKLTTHTKGFILSGGTALALQLGHRKSFDFDFFSQTEIPANLLEKLFSSHIQINYISNITGHGLKKLMRARPDFTYRVEKILPPQPVFSFIQNHSTLSDFEMYQTFNMGMDYALFIPEKHAPKSLSIIKEEGYEAIDAGYVSPGKKQIVIEPKNIVYLRDSLDLR